MTATLFLDEIVQRHQAVTNEFSDFCSNIPESSFFSQPADKWSIAQNIQHLIISAKRTKLAFSLPKFIIKLVVGKSNRPSKTYDELVTKYKLKLEQGGRASTAFVPKEIPKTVGQQKMIYHFSNSMNQLINAIQKNWTDKDLDNYIAPHPLLGKITLRELCYFTIHHVYHHLNTIRARLNEFEMAEAAH